MVGTALGSVQAVVGVQPNRASDQHIRVEVVEMVLAMRKAFEVDLAAVHAYSALACMLGLLWV